MKKPFVLLIIVFLIAMVGVVTAQYISLDSPLDDVWINTTNYTFSFIPISMINISFSCNLIVNSNLFGFNNSVFNNTLTTILSNSSIPEGQNQWYVNCSDFNFTNSSQVRTLYVDVTPPTPMINLTNNSWTNIFYYNMSFNITDNFASSINYTFFMNDVNISSGIVENGSSSYFLTDQLSTGLYKLKITMGKDHANNSNNSTEVYLNVDQDLPEFVNITSPLDLSNVSVPIYFNFTTRDNVDPVLNYTLYLRMDLIDYPNKSGLTTGNNSINFFELELPEMFYQWKLRIEDNSGNVQDSPYFSFTALDITAPTTAPPLNQSGVNDNDGEGYIELQWLPDPNATYYRIYRKSLMITTAEGMTPIYETNNTFFEDLETRHGSNYWYAITSLDHNKNENKSIVSPSFIATANDTKMPVSVSNVSFITNLDGSVVINWEEVNSCVDSNFSESHIYYEIFRTNNISNFNSSLDDEKIKKEYNKLNFTDYDIHTGENYTYFILVRDYGGNYNDTIFSFNQFNTTHTSCYSVWTKWLEVTSCVDGLQTMKRTRICYGSGISVQQELFECRSGGGIIVINRTEEENITYVPEDIQESEEQGWIEASWINLSDKGEIIMLLNSSTIGITEIKFRIKDQKNTGSSMRVRKAEQLPFGYGFGFFAEPYEFFEISKINISNTDFDGNITIKFKVNASWLAENSISNFNVFLYRHYFGWIPLPTKVLGFDGKTFHYEVKTPGLSYFGIGGVSEEFVPVIFPQYFDTELPVQENPWTFLIIAFALFSIIIGYYMYNMKKHSYYW